MRYVWGSLVGLLLCGTVVYAGISSEDLEDGVSSTSVEDVLSLLRSEQLMRAEDDEECDCGDKGTCSFEGEEKTKTCECQPKYAEKDGICEECDCGDKRTCSFEGEEKTKTCVCEPKYAEKEGKCEECDCGDKRTCSFEGEENTKTCKCQPKYAEKDGICEECDCGEKGTCSFEGDEKKKTCVCDMNYLEKDGKCEECDCGEKGNCSFVGDEKKKTCVCDPNYKDKDGKCEECDCGVAQCSFDQKGKQVCTCPVKKAYFEKKCVECDCGETDKCELDEKGKPKKCECEPKQELFQKKCKTCDCAQKLCQFSKNGSKVCFCPDKKAIFKDGCVDCDCGDTEFCDVDKEGNKKTCKCNPGQKLYGEKCVFTCKSDGTKKCNKDFRKCDDKDDGYTCGECLENYKEYNGKCIDTCATKGNTECSKVTRKCVDNDNGYVCGECKDNYKEDKGICRRKCDETSKCKNGGTCVDDFCICKKGYEGDLCDPKCNDALNKTCEKAKAVCEYDSVTDEAVCICKDKNFIYKDGSCSTSKWCETNPCKEGECSFEKRIGECKCKDGHFFNYNAEKCEKINPCFTKKDACGANQECNPDDGQCKCIAGYEWEDTEKKKCKDMACDGNGPCFEGSECKETGIANTVKCLCKKHYFYDGRKCEDGGCFLKDKKCSRCPDGTKHNEVKDVCEIEDKSKSCKDDCGFGWCIKQEDDKNKCVCDDSSFVTENEGKCVLDEGACASGEVEADGKRCKCTGIYKLSSDGITCERKTCEDAEIKKECESKNAKCVTLWDEEKSHSCECEPGYVKYPPPNGKCVRPCEIDNLCSGDRTCYLKKEENDYDCKCPPSFKYIENKDLCVPDSSETNVILKGLSVKKEKYLKNKEIDLTKLNKDVIDAMNAIYFKGELDFALLYKYKTVENTIVCDVWLQFNENNKGNADRWKFVKAQSSILPPALQLSDGEWQKKVNSEKMEFCTEEIKTRVCGQHTVCKDKKCSCKGKGYREIKASVTKYDGDFLSMFCEDIDECKESTHECTTNTTCINTAGDYFCKCKEGYKKAEGEPNADNKISCTDLCTPNPCKSGTCKVKENSVDCTCTPGAGGSLCDREDENFKRASKNTVVVGAVLGTILGVVIILLAFYIRRQRKNSYSEDFTPPPRMDNAEMVERGRPMRGVNNRGYQN